MRVALTGATGYTGSRLLAVMLGRGDTVRALARPSSKRPALAAAPTWIEGDLADVGALSRLVEGVDAVVHVAAVYRTAGHTDAYYRAVNVEGTVRLLEAAARAGVRRFVHTSTVGVHGHVETEVLIKRIFVREESLDESLVHNRHIGRGLVVSLAETSAATNGLTQHLQVLGADAIP